MGDSTAARRGGLWRQRNFRLLWGGETVSGLGDAMAGVVVPLVAVAVLHASALGVSALTAATYVPYLVFGLPAGAWVDRLPPRRVMVVCDLVQLVGFASVPLAASLGALSLAQLLAVNVVVGTASMVFDTAYSVYLTVLVAPDDLMEGNAKLSGTGSVNRVIGPGLGGLAAGALGPATSLLFQAGSFLASAGSLVAIGPVELERPRGKAPTTIRQDIAEGLRAVFADRYLRPLAVWAALANVGFAGYFGLIVVYLVRDLHLSAGAVGAILTAGGLGGVLGATVARKLADRFGTARTLAVNCSVTSVCGLLVVAARPGATVALAVIGVLALEGGLVLGSVILAAFRQRYVEAGLLGRVSTSQRVLTYGIAPPAALIAGALADTIGPRLALTAMLAVEIAGTAILFRRPFRGLRDLPRRTPDPPPPSP